MYPYGFRYRIKQHCIYEYSSVTFYRISLANSDPKIGK